MRRFASSYCRRLSVMPTACAPKSARRLDYQRAPAAPDIQQPLPGAQAQLAQRVVELRRLRRLERIHAFVVVGARIHQSADRGTTRKTPTADRSESQSRPDRAPANARGRAAMLRATPATRVWAAAAARRSNERRARPSAKTKLETSRPRNPRRCPRRRAGRPQKPARSTDRTAARTRPAAPPAHLRLEQSEVY